AGIGDDRNADGIGPIADVQAGCDISGGIDAAAHFEWVNGIETRVAVRPIDAINENARHSAAIFLNDNSISVSHDSGGIGQSDIDPAWLGPLVAIEDIRAAGDFELNCATAWGEGLRADINLSVDRVRVIHGVLRVGLAVSRQPD